MATERMYKLLMESFNREISNNPKAMNLVEVQTIDQNPELLTNAYTEAYSEGTESNFKTVQGLFEKINMVVPIPKTLELFADYRKPVE